ncbi:lactate racemase domain-containing protein [Paludisphaera mucosa]|uniref:Lactate racemase domain-containing protein n=1 Tax=Paludisphaera mucosa TaxID=3030827 RepID=A0ABT6F831_9BACT|nr:lactate racemase domain-containing protein [Paludisphaera mucosa]
MSRYVIEFGSERLDLELVDDAEVEAFTPPVGMAGEDAESALREALERPRNYPPLRQNVVPGDRVAIALDPDLPDPRKILDVVTEVLEGAGVEPDAITIVEASRRVGAVVSVSRGVATEVHDPTNRDRLAYLATTSKESRVYLNRTLTDADVVLPIGFLRQDPLAGPHGPWSVLFPGLSDAESRETHRQFHDVEPGAASPLTADAEAFEVGWLLGSQFQIGIVPGSRGPVAFVAGKSEDVRDAGLTRLDRDWSFRPAARAELVIAGVGGSEGPANLQDLVAGLTTASRLVQRGGKIAVLSRVESPLGPAMQRLAAADDEENAHEILAGRESDPDFLLARTLTHVLAWADVYLLSRLDPGMVEDLSMIPLDRPEEVRRLAVRSPSCLVVGRSDRVRAEARNSDA